MPDFGEDPPVGCRAVGRSATAMLEGAQRSEGVVLAAGGMVVRRSEGSRDAEFDVAVVHRPLREDWSFPKGKLEPGETLEQCAVREVEEETGLHCRLGPFVGHTEYRDRLDRQKVVTYWTMTVERGEFFPGSEVDELRWVDVEDAARLLTYERDRELLGALAASARELFIS
jgi:8-oxo-dGTP pyrophosphatase MutT (NUDIX family)